MNLALFLSGRIHVNWMFLERALLPQSLEVAEKQ
jgi:hypothetical protein